MRLTLGPVLFNWPAADWQSFYFRIADEAPVDTVVIGEVVCSKRMPLVADALPAVIERLARAGKEVILATLALVTQPRERKAMAELARDDAFLVEANDLSVVHHLAGRPHAIGPFVNVYNAATARVLARKGAQRICLPPELPGQSVGAIAAGVPEALIEVFAFGRVPLAISARCYHARLNKLAKDNCRFVCEEDPDGLAVRTLDKEDFLAINGVQTLSYTCANLLGDAASLAASGVQALRLSPQRCDMVAVAGVFRDVLDGRQDADEGLSRLAALYPVPFANGFLRGLPGAEWTAGP